MALWEVRQQLLEEGLLLFQYGGVLGLVCEIFAFSGDSEASNSALNRKFGPLIVFLPG